MRTLFLEGLLLPPFPEVNIPDEEREEDEEDERLFSCTPLSVVTVMRFFLSAFLFLSAPLLPPASSASTRVTAPFEFSS